MTSPVGGKRARPRDVAGALPRPRAVALLSGALALAAADQTVAGAVAPDLKADLMVGNTRIGLLVTAASVAAALTTLPFGMLADRTRRVRLLAGCALIWSASMVLAGFAHSYSTLLVAQIALGAGVGATGPVVASLSGDLFDTAVRGRALGLILAGEFAGAASGLLIAGEVAAVWSWRGSFWVLAAVGPLLAVALVHGLAEPARGQQQQHTPQRAPEAKAAGLAAAVRRTGAQPRESLILTGDPARKPLGWAVRYVLSIPSNVVIIVASALCYFYVAGIQTFAVVFLRGRFDLSQQLATALLVLIGAGVILGILISGQVSDRLIARGRAAARPLVGGLFFLAAVLFFVPGFVLPVALAAIPLLFLGAAGLGGVNPPLDAARLDVMHSRLWGRAESVRTFCQTLFKSGAPLLFGYLSTVLAAPGERADAVQGGGATGLTRTFLVLQVLLAAAGLVLLVARRGYLRDVATAVASERATSVT